MPTFSIECPAQEDHVGDIHKPGGSKVMFFMAEDGLILFCKRHRWIKFKFSKHGKQLNFKNVEITAHSLPDDIRIKHLPMPVMAYGEFRSRNGKRNKG